WKLVLPLVMAALWSMWIAVGDYGFAQAARTAANEIAKFARPVDSEFDRRVYFEGHWGFQHYMEAAGFEALDYAAPTIGPGDLLAIPANNTNLMYFEEARPIEEISVPVPWGVATINLRL